MNELEYIYFFLTKEKDGFMNYLSNKYFVWKNDRIFTDFDDSIDSLVGWSKQC